jgi:hypothetical protein
VPLWANYLSSLIKIRRIWWISFHIDGCGTLRTVALRRPIFKQKKGFATISLGLNYCSMGSSHSLSRDTVPLKWRCDRQASELIFVNFLGSWKLGQIRICHCDWWCYLSHYRQGTSFCFFAFWYFVNVIFCYISACGRCEVRAWAFYESHLQ